MLDPLPQSGLGCRPSPTWIAMALDRAGMHHVYAPTTRPDFPDYLFEWRNDLAWSRDGHPSITLEQVDYGHVLEDKDQTDVRRHDDVWQRMPLSRSR